MFSSTSSSFFSFTSASFRPRTPTLFVQLTLLSSSTCSFFVHHIPLFSSSLAYDFRSITPKTHFFVSLCSIFVHPAQCFRSPQLSFRTPHPTIFLHFGQFRSLQHSFSPQLTVFVFLSPILSSTSGHCPFTLPHFWSTYFHCFRPNRPIVFVQFSPFFARSARFRPAKPLCFPPPLPPLFSSSPIQFSSTSCRLLTPGFVHLNSVFVHLCPVFHSFSFTSDHFFVHIKSVFVYITPNLFVHLSPLFRPSQLNFRPHQPTNFVHPNSFSSLSAHFRPPQTQFSSTSKICSRPPQPTIFVHLNSFCPPQPTFLPPQFNFRPPQPTVFISPNSVFIHLSPSLYPPELSFRPPLSTVFFQTHFRLI